MDDAKPAAAPPGAPEAMGEMSLLRWIVVAFAGLVLLWHLFTWREGARAAPEQQVRLAAELLAAVVVAVGAVVVCLLWSIRDAVRRMTGNGADLKATP